MRRDRRVWVWRIAGGFDMPGGFDILGGFGFLKPQTYIVTRPPPF